MELLNIIYSYAIKYNIFLLHKFYLWLATNVLLYLDKLAIL